MSTHTITSGALTVSQSSALGGAGVMIVQEFGQLLAQALIALGLVAENDGPFEQGMLQFGRQAAPKVRGRRSEGEKETRGIVVQSHRMGLYAHDDLDCRR
jgi:hypothetical protein